MRSGTVMPTPVPLAIEPARTERRWQAIPIHPVFKQMVDPTNLVLVEEIAHYLDYRPGRHGPWDWSKSSLALRLLFDKEFAAQKKAEVEDGIIEAEKDGYVDLTGPDIQWVQNREVAQWQYRFA